MSTISIKRIYDAPAATDGVRILVDRLWPRGVRKESAALDYWVKDIAPTPGLRTWFDHRPDRFAEFTDRYLDELRSNPAVTETLDNLGRKNATLLYAARDPEVNHAVVLARYLQHMRTKKASKGK